MPCPHVTNGTCTICAAAWDAAEAFDRVVKVDDYSCPEFDKLSAAMISLDKALGRTIDTYRQPKES